MQNIPIFFLSITLILSTLSCDRNKDRINRIYVLENQTQHPITIDFYEYGKFQYTAGSDTPGVIGQGKSTNDAGSTLSANDALDADSAVVFFDTIKKQTYYLENFTPKSSPSSTHNVFIDEHYEIQNEELYRFRFTEEDYLTADSL